MAAPAMEMTLPWMDAMMQHLDDEDDATDVTAGRTVVMLQAEGDSDLDMMRRHSQLRNAVGLCGTMTEGSESGAM